MLARNAGRIRLYATQHRRPWGEMNFGEWPLCRGQGLCAAYALTTELLRMSRPAGGPPADPAGTASGPGARAWACEWAPCRYN